MFVTSYALKIHWVADPEKPTEFELSRSQARRVLRRGNVREVFRQPGLRILHYATADHGVTLRVSVDRAPVCPCCDTSRKPANGCAGFVAACDCDAE